MCMFNALFTDAHSPFSHSQCGITLQGASGSTRPDSILRGTLASWLQELWIQPQPSEDWRAALQSVPEPPRQTALSPMEMFGDFIRIKNYN